MDFSPIVGSIQFITELGFDFGPRDRAISASQSSYSDAEPTVYYGEPTRV